MTTVSATQLKQKTAEVLDHSRREPIMIRRHDRDAAVITSPDIYEDYERLKAKEILELCEEMSTEAKANGLTQEILERLLSDDRGDDAA